MNPTSLTRTQRALGISLILIALVLTTTTTVMAQVLLDPVTHPKFVTNLPIPARFDLTQGGKFDFEMREAVQWYGLYDPAGNMLLTTIWGYGQPDDVMGGLPVTSPGPTFVAMSNVGVDIKWKNKLPKMYNFPYGPNAHLLPVDPKNHNANVDRGGVPLVTHLHGGHTEWASDGLPEAWFTQGYKEKGRHFVKRKYHYDNDQEAATLWYHDHALGVTRLNVYAGLAGFYLLRDQNELNLMNTGVLPGGQPHHDLDDDYWDDDYLDDDHLDDDHLDDIDDDDCDDIDDDDCDDIDDDDCDDEWWGAPGPYEVEIVIQDRMFSADGELFFPSANPEIAPGFPPLPPGPSIIAEFFGDFIMVNGAVWPKLDVEPRKYRLRYLNGSDSRFYVLEFHDAEMGGIAQPFLQIGTDDGLLEQPVELTRLLIAPGERMDLVVDFRNLTEVTLRNFGPDSPFKGFNPDGSVSDGAGGVAPPADPATTGKLMKFNVVLPLDRDVPDAMVAVGTVLRPAIMPLVQTGETRDLVLFEGLDEFGRLQPMLGTLAEGSQTWFQPITENPMLNDVEQWEVYNATEDAHPIHLHLVAFQIINRESFDGFVTQRPQEQHNGTFGVGGILTVTGLGGDARLPDPNEMGWKDTVVMLPGEVTRVIACFDREGRYVWHCHILSHEDHEMMRPFQVGPIPMSAPPMAVASEKAPARTPASTTLGQNYPNPFNPATQIRFQLSATGRAEVAVYDVKGRLVKNLASQVFGAGTHVLDWDGRDDAGNMLSSGIYFYKLTAGSFTETKRMVLVR